MQYALYIEVLRDCDSDSNSDAKPNCDWEPDGVAPAIPTIYNSTPAPACVCAYHSDSDFYYE